MFDIKKLAQDAEAEVAEEDIKQAKKKLVTKQRDIRHAKRIVANLEREYQSLLLEISEDVG